MRYRKIDPRIFHDENFRALDSNGKLAAIYALINSNRIGLFYLNPFQAADETGLGKSWDTVWDTVCHTLSWGYDKGIRVVFFPNWWKYNRPDNDKHFIGCLSDLHEVPSCPLILDFLEEKRHIPPKWHHYLDTVSIRYRYGIGQVSVTGAVAVAVAVAGDGARAGETDFCPETQTAASRVPESSEPSILDFPCDGKIKTWSLTETQLREWKELYPHLDILGECRKALAWIKADATRCKTAKGMARFLVGWFGRAQNNGHSGNNGKPKQRECFRDRGIMRGTPEQEAEEARLISQVLGGPPDDDEGFRWPND